MELRNLLKKIGKSHNFKENIQNFAVYLVNLVFVFCDCVVALIIVTSGFVYCIKVVLDYVASIIGRRLKQNGFTL